MRAAMIMKAEIGFIREQRAPVSFGAAGDGSVCLREGARLGGFIGRRFDEGCVEFMQPWTK